MMPMLAFIFFCVAVGLFTRAVNARVFVVLALVGLAMTSLYLYAPWLM
jgi:hypothetical protein